MLGNFGLNTDLKASKEQPLSIVAKDFDKSGNIDPILGYYSEGVQLPFLPRCLAAQITAMKRRFPYYKDYAKAGFGDVFTSKELEGALTKDVNCLASILLLNNGKGGFESQILPNQAQLAPLYGVQLIDVNDDNKLDILGVGNRSDTETLGGFMDAQLGLFLKGNGDGTFETVSNLKSGINLFKKDSRTITAIVMDGKLAYLVGNNDDSATVLRSMENSKMSFVDLKPTDAKGYILQGDKVILAKENCYSRDTGDKTPIKSAFLTIATK